MIEGFVLAVIMGGSVNAKIGNTWCIGCVVCSVVEDFVAWPNPTLSDFAANHEVHCSSENL